ncbi:MAG: hypothetical protein B7X42_08385 [Thiomonas sp. 14-66-4]|nr:MAG: hypothetical protein B7X42_08385 [Thiomonas sp. 14-66-4]
MRQVQRELAVLQGTQDPLEELARRIARRFRLICFDEFHISDVTDAMILHRLLRGLFEQGVVLMATSNFRPDDLYPDGLHRDRILPAIELIKTQMDVIEVDGGVDYRHQALVDMRLYYTPLGQAADLAMEHAFARLAEELQAEGAHVRRHAVQHPARAGDEPVAALLLDAGQAGEAGGQGVDVGQVIGQRIGLLAQVPRHSGRHRAGDDVALAESLEEVFGDEPADLLRLQVIGVVVAVRQHIGADEDAPLDLRAEALGAALRIHLGQVAVVRRAVAVAHAVEAREIARRLRRRHQVVGGDGQLGARQGDVHQRGAEACVDVQRRAHRQRDLMAEALGEVLARQADAQPGQGLVGGRAGTRGIQ